MAEWASMTDVEKLENVRRWRDYFKKDRDAANKEIEQLEAERAELIEIIEKLLAACRAANSWLSDFYQNAPVSFGGEIELGRMLQDVIEKAEGES